MKGLIMKDIMNLRQYGKQLILIYVFYIACSIMGMWDMSFFVALAIMIGGSSFLSTLTYDDMAKWNIYALTMPVTRKDLVDSKFALLIGSMLVNTVLSLTMASVFQMIQGKLALVELVITAAAVLLVALAGFSGTLFLSFKLGAEKARIFLMVIFLVPTVVVYLLGTVAKKAGSRLDLTFLEENLQPILGGGAVVLVAVVVICYLLSVRVMAKKEF